MSDNTHASSSEAVSAWWAEQLGAPVYRMVDSRASGNDRLAADFSAALMHTIADRHPVSREQGEKFIAALIPKIEDQLSRTGQVTLGVDYGPDRILGEAAEAADIDKSRFPWKTVTWIKETHVAASLGYGGKTRLIWSEPGWERPPCGQRNCTGDWEPIDEVCPLPLYHDGDCGQWIPDPQRCTACGGAYAAHHSSGSFLSHSWSPEVPS